MQVARHLVETLVVSMAVLTNNRALEIVKISNKEVVE